MDPANPLIYLAIPCISAATGYITNHIAVRMLFRPRTERRVLGLRLQGLIPRRRAPIARKIGETVHKHLISHDDIRKVLSAPEVTEGIHKVLDRRITHFLTEKLPKANTMIAIFLTEDMAKRIKNQIMDEVMQAIPNVTDQMMDTLENNLDFKKVVVRKIEEFDLEKFENIVLEIASRDLRAIEILGGVLGFAIGLVTDLLLIL